LDLRFSQKRLRRIDLSSEICTVISQGTELLAYSLLYVCAEYLLVTGRLPGALSRKNYGNIPINF
jgi:hypothetical protein